MGLQVREMKEEDWPQVYDIYRQGMETGLATFTVKQMTYQEFDADRLPAGRLVIQDQESILGWTTLRPISDIPEYHGVAEVSIYIDRSAHGKGIATTLLTCLIRLSEAAGYWMLESDIFSNNEGSIKLHEKCGFRLVGRRERIGRDQQGLWRDTVIMERRSRVVGVD